MWNIVCLTLNVLKIMMKLIKPFNEAKNKFIFWYLGLYSIFYGKRTCEHDSRIFNVLAKLK